MYLEKGISAQAIKKKLEGHRQKDHKYLDGKIFNSICTEPLIVAKDAYQQFLSTNLGDKRIYRGTAEIERETVTMLGEIFGNKDAPGSIVSGGTEANILALYAARQIAEKKGKEKFEVIVPESVHFSIIKAAKLLNLKLVFTKLDSSYRADPEAMKDSITDNTIAIVVSAGTSELGMIDPYDKVEKIAKERELYFHIDAASGGFILPFQEEPRRILLQNGVSSITVDPHKYGFSVIPSGAILFKDKEIMDHIQFPSFFDGTQAHNTVLGTRSGAGAAATYAVMSYMGRFGYGNCVKKILEITHLGEQYVVKKGLVLFQKSDLNIISICSKNPVIIQEILEEQGFIISVCKKYNVIRLVIHLQHTYPDVVKVIDLIQELESRVCV